MQRCHHSYPLSRHTNGWMVKCPYKLLTTLGVFSPLSEWEKTKCVDGRWCSGLLQWGSHTAYLAGTQGSTGSCEVWGSYMDLSGSLWDYPAQRGDSKEVIILTYTQVEDEINQSGPASWNCIPNSLLSPVLTLQIPNKEVRGSQRKAWDNFPGEVETKSVYKQGKIISVPLNPYRYRTWYVISSKLALDLWNLWKFTCLVEGL